MPNPRSRLQSVPGLCGRPGVGPRRHRQRPAAAGRISRRHLSRVRIAARPKTLAEAIERFEQSEFCRRAFGADVVQHYTHYFRTEQAQYDRAVTDWERGRYFERI